jgi:hypothetical protein
MDRSNNLNRSSSISQEAPLEQISRSFLGLIESRLRGKFIAEVAVRFCPPLTYKAVAQKFECTSEYIGQVIEKYYPDHSRRVNHE